MQRTRTLAAALVLLAGCAAPPQVEEMRLPIEAALMQPCPKLRPLDDDNLTGRALTDKIIELAWMYHDCADGKQKLIDAVK